MHESSNETKALGNVDANDLSAQQLAERRAWHLAFLLTQDEERATPLVMGLVRSHPELISMPLPMRDRMLIQHLREPKIRRAAPSNGAPKATPASPTKPLAAPTLAAMPAQAREAFILARVDKVDPLWMAQAMDCSKTAARVHLEAAEEAYRNAKVDPQTEIDALDRASNAISPDRIGRALAREREAKQRLRKRRIAIAIGIALIAASVALLIFLQMTHGANGA